jgi:archaellum component FlaC
MKVTNGTNPNNQVPKDTVDNIMKTYENIINQHLKNMEQISESIKELHTTSYNIEKTMKEYIDGKIKDMVEKFEKNVEEKRKILEKVEEDITGPFRETDTNLKGINENISEVAEEVKNISINVHKLKNKIYVFVGTVVLVAGLVGTIYNHVQKSNEEIIKKYVATAVAEIISTRPSNTVPSNFLQQFDKNRDGLIDDGELKEAQRK